jgi:hypothetical protein
VKEKRQHLLKIQTQVKGPQDGLKRNKPIVQFSKPEVQKIKLRVYDAQMILQKSQCGLRA